MKLRAKVMMGLIGLGMLAAPISASAWDDDYHYRDRGYYSNPYVMPRSYAGGACAWARHLRIVYNQDRYRGHPAAARDLIPQMHRAERACAAGTYGYGYW